MYLVQVHSNRIDLVRLARQRTNRDDYILYDSDSNTMKKLGRDGRIVGDKVSQKVKL